MSSVKKILPIAGMAVGGWFGGPAGASLGGSIGGALAGGGSEGGGGGGGNGAISQAYAAEQAKTQRWNEIYGDTATNLKDYYNKLTPEVLAAKGLTETAQKYNDYHNEITKTMAQRNLQGSGIETHMKASANLQQARDNASITANAPQLVANARNSFLNGGGGVQQGNTSQLAGAMQTQQNQTQANTANMMGVLGSGLDSMLNSKGSDGGASILDQAKFITNGIFGTSFGS